MAPHHSSSVVEAVPKATHPRQNKNSHASPMQTQGSLASEEEPHDKLGEADLDFNSKLEDFIKQVSAALPQPILNEPLKKLTALFKHPISPSVIQAIKELVSFGGGEALLKGIEKKNMKATPQQMEA
ncbi:hypothetical protein GUJ93_ZPchr0010g10694 [Zizania palustris]|uniref:Uncharacterized protein n=1 Tax=Zizania palustris TaxID=103762 RepID=A0A8J5THU4_ZIZPA|nr:hypothetical protein GUJ93_ZPchr0010g10694 [Zizania palustris]